MKHLLSKSLLLAVLLIAGSSFAQIPKTISYQGVLTDSSGMIVPDGQYQLFLSIYDQAASGISIWDDLQQVNTNKGVFNVILGSATALNLAFNKPYWLELEVDGEVLSPRTELTASAYSFNTADVADSIITSAKIADGQVVRTLNGLSDDVTLSAGANVTITPQGGNLVIGATGGTGNSPWTTNNNDIYFQGGNVGVGTTTPSEQLELTGNLKLPATASGGNSPIGVLYSDTSHVLHTYGADNFFAGEGAGNFTTIGQGSNTGIGSNALVKIGGGDYNTAVGANALGKAVSGRDNTALGANAMMNTTLGRSNIAVGINAMRDNVSGSHNVAIGRSAASTLTTGTNNVVIGPGTGFGFQTGSNNTLIGNGANVLSSDAVNATAIGQGAFAASNTIRLGNSQITEVNTAGTINAAAFVGDGSGLTNIPGGQWEQSGLNIYRAGGRVGIRNSAPERALDVNGGARIINDSDFSGLQIDQSLGSNPNPGLLVNASTGAAQAIKVFSASGNADGLNIDKAGGTGSAIEALHNGEGSAIYARQWGIGPAMYLTNQGRAAGVPGGNMLEIHNTGADSSSIRIDHKGIWPAIKVNASGEGILIDVDDTNGFYNRDGLTVFTNGGGVLTGRIFADEPQSTFSPAIDVEVNHGGNAMWLRSTISRNDVRVAEITKENVQFDNEVLSLHANDNPQIVNFSFISADRDGDTKFSVSGSGQVFSDGGFAGSGSDFAEMVEIEGGYATAEPGDVMVISTGKDRAMEESSVARSTLVMGVYSSKPGFVGSERSWDTPAANKEDTKKHNMEYMKTTFNEVPLAVVGIVPCKVSAENGAIRRGDLLVTSSTPGHAMRDDDPKNGTIVGKALGELNSGTGLIKVLITLQ